MLTKETVIIKGLYNNTTTVYYCTVASTNNYYNKRFKSEYMWLSCKDIFSIEDLVLFTNVFKAKIAINILRKNSTYVDNVELILLKDTSFIKYIPHANR